MPNILLIEPNYKNKYPPLSLMKISTYHKNIGDNVIFCKGKNTELQLMHWDRIYITTLFTFHWDITIDTIDFYKNSVNDISEIYCGGVLATVLSDKLYERFNVTIISGLMDNPGILGDNDIVVDLISPDYSIIDAEQNKYLEYIYPMSDAYIAYATRGCIRNCNFCAVPTIEPIFNHYIDIKEQVAYIKNNFSEKKDLMLLDNNVLASKQFDKIIDDIKEVGFYKDAYYLYQKNGKTSCKKRYVDFNQGIDARLLTREKCLRLAEIAIKPLRIAFDSAEDKAVELYKEKSILAAECGIEHLSNYMLFNFEDTPDDLYIRLKVVADLNEYFEKQGYKTRIWSFPMKYSPIKGENCFDRKYIGVNWKQKHLRAIQCILNATHGLVGPKKAFFHIAFGKDLTEYHHILAMPEHLIINRTTSEKDGSTGSWTKYFDMLDPQSEIYDFIMEGDYKNIPIKFQKENILQYYTI